MVTRLLVEATYPDTPDTLFSTACPPKATSGQIGFAGHTLTVEHLDPAERILHATGDGAVRSLRRTVLPGPQGAQWRDIVMVSGWLTTWRLRLTLRWQHHRRGGRQIRTSAVAMLD